MDRQAWLAERRSAVATSCCMPAGKRTDTRFTQDGEWFGVLI